MPRPDMGPRTLHPANTVQNPRSLRSLVFNEATWAANISVGDTIEFWGYAGRGREGPEYRLTKGKVHLIGPAGPVVSVGGRYGSPVVVEQDRFVRVVRRARQNTVRRRGLRSRKAPGNGRARRRSNPFKAVAPLPGEKVSETWAWTRVSNLAHFLVRNGKLSAQHYEWVKEIVHLASVMKDQVAHGVHRNPTLGILAANPGTPKIVKVLSKGAYEIAYRHTEDGKNYWHEFAPGIHIGLLSDGNVILWHPTKRLWRKFD